MNDVISVVWRLRGKKNLWEMRVIIMLKTLGQKNLLMMCFVQIEFGLNIEFGILYWPLSINIPQIDNYQILYESRFWKHACVSTCLNCLSVWWLEIEFLVLLMHSSLNTLNNMFSRDDKFFQQSKWKVQLRICEFLGKRSSMEDF